MFANIGVDTAEIALGRFWIPLGGARQGALGRRHGAHPRSTRAARAGHGVGYRGVRRGSLGHNVSHELSSFRSVCAPLRSRSFVYLFPTRSANPSAVQSATQVSMAIRSWRYDPNGWSIRNMDAFLSLKYVPFEFQYHLKIKTAHHLQTQ